MCGKLFQHVWISLRAINFREFHNRSPRGDEDGSDGEVEEKPDVDSDEEINCEEVQLEDTPEDAPKPSVRLRKTQLLELPPPSYPDYPENAWPAFWKGSPAPRPGEAGFNEYAGECIQHVLDFWSKRGLCNGHESYQLTAMACAHPLSPCKRVLVDARMGAGKTKVLIAVLEQHFHDRRKKLPIFPTKALTVNFLDELLRWPNSHLDL